MIVCRKCSRHNPDGTDFCACGAFLEFDGERLAEEPPRTRAASPEAGPIDAGRRTASERAPETAQPDRAPWSAFGSGNWTDAPTSAEVTAQLPDEPDTVRSPDEVVVQPAGRAGDVTCDRCRTPNAPERQFCRHCGQALSGTAAVPATAPAMVREKRKVPWWRRLTGRIPDNVRTTDPRQLALQARRLSRGGLSSRSVLFRSGGVAVVLATLLAFLGPWKGPVIRWSRDQTRLTRYTEVDLDVDDITVVANPDATPQEFPLQGTGNLIDDARNTAWATHWLDMNKEGPEETPADCQVAAGADSWFVITFPEPTDLARIHVLGGRAEDQGLNRTAYLRPRLIQVRINDDERCAYVELEDKGTPETKGFKFGNVETLDMRIVGVYGTPDALPTVEISELIFDKQR